ncbi:hypothetical protein PTKIN_Ptkin09bG0137900 [Pterospermum kingtungense]
MASDETCFCDDYYFLLNPEEASYFDIVSLLFYSELEKRRFIHNAGHQDGNFRRRWLIFISVLVQKLLLLGRKPLALMGIVVETWLNLLSCNGGLSMLLLNFITGKLVWPDRSSPMFRSILGNIDTRFELDNNIKPGDNKYKASLSMMAAKISYENEAFIKTRIIEHWKMKFLKLYNFWNDFQERYSTQAFMFEDTRANPNLIVVAFRGTSPFSADDWRTDVDISWLRKVLKQNPEARFILTGHSLGGALAILFPAVLMLHEEEWLLQRLDGVYTFGQPKVGDEKFGEFMKERLRKFGVKYFRYVYGDDLVPRVPSDDKTLFFKHIAPCLYFNSFYKGKVLSEEPNKNYFSLPWVLPKITNAIWELIRGFIIPYWKGPEYKEGWFLRLWRIIGLVAPGVSAHLLQDYVNSTRLGTLPLDLQVLNPVHENQLKTD